MKQVLRGRLCDVFGAPALPSWQTADVQLERCLKHCRCFSSKKKHVNYGNQINWTLLMDVEILFSLIFRHIKQAHAHSTLPFKLC